MALFSQYVQMLPELRSDHYLDPAVDMHYSKSGELVGEKFGIPAKKLELFTGQQATITFMRNLPVITAIRYYHRRYWLPNRIGRINDQDFANLLCDGIISHPKIPGCNGFVAIVLLQEVLEGLGEEVNVNGVMSSSTLAAINRQLRLSKPRLFNKYKDRRRLQYESKSLGDPAYSLVMSEWSARLAQFPDMPYDPDVVIEPAPELREYFDGSYNVALGLGAIPYSRTARQEWLVILLGIALFFVLVKE